MAEHYGKIRYDRFIGGDVIESDQSCKLRIVIDAIRNLQPNIENSKYSFDIHLREKSQVMVYHGGTCLLIIKTNFFQQNIQVVFFSPSYKNNELCSDQFKMLAELNNLNDIELVLQRISTFLLKAVSAVSKKWFSKEAFYASKLSIDYGRCWHPGLDWLIIDREAVLGFESSELKSQYYQNCKMATGVIAGKLKDEDPKFWGKNLKKFGDEVDFLAIGSKGQLVCIELKHESFVSGIYWSPIQASVYREAFRDAIEAISDSIIKLVHQKVALGLLPIQALERLPEKFTSVESVVFVVCGGRKSKCWDKLTLVRKMLPEPIDIYTSDLSREDSKFNLLELA